MVDINKFLDIDLKDINSRKTFYKFVFVYFVSVVFVSLAIIIWNDYQNANEIDRMSKTDEIKIIKKGVLYETANVLDWTPMKYILFWTPMKYDPLYYLRTEGQAGFIRNKCKFNNCFATSNRKLFGDEYDNFDAIVFNGQAYKNRYIKNYEIPYVKTQYQLYVFFELQSSSTHSICYSFLDNFFNWAMTYKLDSEIPLPFILIKNKTGNIIGPKINMQWINDSSDVDDVPILNKSKPIAWLPTDCYNLSRGNIVADSLNKALAKYELKMYIHGKCGPVACVKRNRNCEYLRNNYYFLLVVENSDAEDYVTHKVLFALQNDMVPVMFGGANYSRFLPPGSYIDGTIKTPEAIAAEIYKVVVDPSTYKNYFRWKKHYSYTKAEYENMACLLCEALNDIETRSTLIGYRDFKRWWTTDYDSKCT